MDDKNSSRSTPDATEATVPSARAHHAGDGGGVAGGPKRFSAKRKLAVVQRLLRGESLEAVSRAENVPVHRLTEWRDKVLMGAESALKERERDARDDEIACSENTIKAYRAHWAHFSRLVLHAGGGPSAPVRGDGRPLHFRRRIRIRQI